MPIDVFWDQILERVIYWQFQGSWTWKEFEAAQKLANTLIDQHAGTVDVIMDLRESGHLPKDALSQIKQRLETRHPRVRFTAVIGAGMVLRNLYQMLHRIFPHHLFQIQASFVDTPGEAYATITDQRAQRPHNAN